MFQNMFFYLFLCLFFFGVGDFLSVVTKAKVSSVFVSLLLFLVAFMTGLIPPDIIKQAGLADFGKWSILFIVFSLGTTINLRELVDEWRTLAVSFLAMGLVVVVSFAMMPIIGKNEALVAIPIVNGGIVATQIMTTAALEHGFALAAALGTIIYAVQKFFGTPFASHFGIKEAEQVIAEYRRTGVNRYKKAPVTTEKGEEKENFFQRNKKYYGVFVSLTITAFFAWLSFVIGKLTGVSAPIWSLLLGVVAASLGIVPKNILLHAKSLGIFNVACFATIIPSLAKIRPEDLIGLGLNTLIIFAGVFVILYIAFAILPCWKILGSKNLALAVSVCQLLGFPATYLIANEVAKAVGKDEAEREVILDAILPKYLVAGFATVSSVSVLIAGILVPFIG